MIKSSFSRYSQCLCDGWLEEGFCSLHVVQYDKHRLSRGENPGRGANKILDESSLDDSLERHNYLVKLLCCSMEVTPQECRLAEQADYLLEVQDVLQQPASLIRLAQLAQQALEAVISVVQVHVIAVKHLRPDFPEPVHPS